MILRVNEWLTLSENRMSGDSVHAECRVCASVDDVTAVCMTLHFSLYVYNTSVCPCRDRITSNNATVFINHFIDFSCHCMQSHETPVRKLFAANPLYMIITDLSIFFFVVIAIHSFIHSFSFLLLVADLWHFSSICSPPSLSIFCCFFHFWILC